MGSGTTHDADKVIVLFAGEDVRAQISDGFGVHFGGSVEAEGDLDVLVAKVAIDGLGCAKNLTFSIVLRKILCQQAGICVGIVSTNHNNSVQIEVCAVLQRSSKLLRRFNLVSTRAYTISKQYVRIFNIVLILTDHIEATHVAIALHVVCSDVHVIVGENAVRAGKETE